MSAARVPRDGPWSIYHCVCSTCATRWSLVRLPLCLQHVCHAMVLGPFTTVSAARVPRDGPWSIYHCVCSTCATDGPWSVYHCVCSTCAKGWSLVRLPLYLQHVCQGMVLGPFTTVSAARVPRDGPWSVYHCVCSTLQRQTNTSFLFIILNHNFDNIFQILR